MNQTIEQQLRTVFGSAHSAPAEDPHTLKLYHAGSMLGATPCKRIVARSKTEAALKTATLGRAVYVERARHCRRCSGHHTTRIGTAEDFLAWAKESDL